MGAAGGFLTPEKRTSERKLTENFTKRLAKGNFWGYNLKLGCNPMTSKFFRRASVKIKKNAKIIFILTDLLTLADV